MRKGPVDEVGELDGRGSDINTDCFEDSTSGAKLDFCEIGDSDTKADGSLDAGSGAEVDCFDNLGTDGAVGIRMARNCSDVSDCRDLT